MSVFSGFDLKDVILVDNSVAAFASQIGNGVPILPYYDQKDDKELVDLSHFLREIVNLDNFPEFFKGYFQMSNYQGTPSIGDVIQRFRDQP